MEVAEIDEFRQVSAERETAHCFPCRFYVFVTGRRSCDSGASPTPVNEALVQTSSI
jgi:hypothetical protein